MPDTGVKLATFQLKVYHTTFNTSRTTINRSLKLFWLHKVDHQERELDYCKPKGRQRDRIPHSYRSFSTLLHLHDPSELFQLIVPLFSRIFY